MSLPLTVNYKKQVTWLYLTHRRGEGIFTMCPDRELETFCDRLSGCYTVPGGEENSKKRAFGPLFLIAFLLYLPDIPTSQNKLAPKVCKILVLQTSRVPFPFNIQMTLYQTLIYFTSPRELPSPLLSLPQVSHFIALKGVSLSSDS